MISWFYDVIFNVVFGDPALFVNGIIGEKGLVADSLVSSMTVIELYEFVVLVVGMVCGTFLLMAIIIFGIILPSLSSVRGKCSNFVKTLKIFKGVS